jgi:hypothetical protein
MHPNRYPPLRWGLLCCALTAPFAAIADVGNPKSAGVTKGETSLEYKAARTGGAPFNNDQEHEFEAYYGLTDRLKLGIEHVKANAPGSASLQTDKNVLNATLNTTHQKEGWWLSTALFAGYGIATGADDASLVLIGERREGPFDIKLNLALGREIGGGREHGVDYKTALQVKYHWLKSLNPALEWHANWGKLNDTREASDQGHYLGPYLSGRLIETPDGQVKWGAGYFWGLTDRSADTAQRVLLEYEFRF